VWAGEWRGRRKWKWNGNFRPNKCSKTSPIGGRPLFDWWEKMKMEMTIMIDLWLGWR